VRPLTWRERLRQRVIWGHWSWRTLLVQRDRIVVGKLKVILHH